MPKVVSTVCVERGRISYHIMFCTYPNPPHTHTHTFVFSCSCSCFVFVFFVYARPCLLVAPAILCSNLYTHTLSSLSRSNGVQGVEGFPVSCDSAQATSARRSTVRCRLLLLSLNGLRVGDVSRTIPRRNPRSSRALRAVD